MDAFEIIFKFNPIYLGSFARCKYISIRDSSNRIIPILSIDEALGTITIALDTGVTAGDKLTVASRSIGCFPSIDDGGELPMLRSQLTSLYNDNIDFRYTNFIPEGIQALGVEEHRLTLNNKTYRFVNYIYHVFKDTESEEAIQTHLIDMGTYARASKPLTMASGSKVINIIVSRGHYSRLVLISGNTVLKNTSPPTEIGGSLISTFPTSVNIANVMIEVST